MAHLTAIRRKMPFSTADAISVLRVEGIDQRDPPVIHTRHAARFVREGTA